MIKRTIQISLFLIVLLIWPLVLSDLTSSTRVAHAAGLTTLSDTMSRNKAAPTLSNHTIQFITPTGVIALNQTITVTFPAGYTMGTFAVNNVDLAVSDSTSCANAIFTDRTIAATAGLDIWVASQTLQVITFSAPATGTIGNSGVPAGRCVQIEIGSNATIGGAGATQITNQSVAQNTTDPKILIAGTFGDSGKIATEILADDQVSITAAVDPALTFSFGSFTGFAFGTFPDTNIRWATNAGSGATAEPGNDNPARVTAFSNANGGFTITVASTGDGAGHAGLYSSGASRLIAATSANTVNTAGNESYALYTKHKLGSAGLTMTPGFNTGTSTTVLITTPLEIAKTTTPTDSATFDVVLKARVKSTTPAGTYVDSLIFICTPSY